jgi:hypothetical protein
MMQKEKSTRLQLFALIIQLLRSAENFRINFASVFIK